VVLLIAIVAAFLICVTIMLFSPFKNILGFQYFIYNSNDYVYNVTNAEDKEVFDFSKIDFVITEKPLADQELMEILKDKLIIA
jgi:hypothetical protein